MKLKEALGGAWIAVIAAVLDRVTKRLVLKLLTAPKTILMNVARFRLTFNTGVAFSMFRDSAWPLTLVIALMIVGVTAWLVARPRSQTGLMRVGLWMIVGGGIGNLFDRLTYGAVIDFIEPLFVNFAVFNVADSFICVGAALTALGAWIREKRGGAK